MADSHTPVVAPPPAPAGGPVLILRSCRAAQFAAAVAQARQRHPGAEVVALSHAGHLEALRAAGIDRVIEIPGRRFGPFRVSPRTWRRLRAERFSTVIVPQMSVFGDAHANLYGLVALLRWERVVVLPGDDAPREFERTAFRRYTRINTVRALARPFDTIRLLGVLARAPWLRRRAPRREGRQRVLHIISSLGVGGAQVQLAELLRRTPPDRYDVELLALGAEDSFSIQWLRSDIRVTVLRDWERVMPAVLDIAACCREGHFDIVHTWLFLANVIGTAGARLAGVPCVVGSVRNLSVWKRDPAYHRWWFRVADVLASHAADVVTVNATPLAADHAAWALMPRSRIEVIHNGLDPSRFACDRHQARERLLAATGAPATAVLVGTVGRLAPEKDQATFIRILAGVRQNRPDVHGVVIGGGDLRPQLEALARDLGIAGSVSFLGTRSDARALIGGLDLFVLSSWSEGFPNVLLEATFHGIPCAATALAGNPEVLAQPEWMFPMRDATAGAERVLAMLSDTTLTAQRQLATRQRALQMFTADRCAAAWLSLYERHCPGGTPQSNAPVQAAA